MPTLNIYLRNHVENSRLLHWSGDKRTQIATQLTRLFTDVCGNTDYVPRVSWVELGGATCQRTDLMCHFVTNETVGPIHGQRLRPSAVGGNTFATARGVISEVYVASRNVLPSGPELGNIAFHELMHNKLDASSSHFDIHTSGGAGLARHSPMHAVLTDQNRRLMRGALDRPVLQFPA